MQELEVFVNDPFDASLIRELFLTQEDLKLASPYSSWPFSEEEWAKLFNSNSENCSLLFYLDGRVIAHTSFLPKDENLYLCYVILHPDFRGKGFSKQIVTLSEEFCRLNYPHEELHLNVNRGNNRAKKLYENMGYVVFAEEAPRFKMKKAL